MFCVFVLGMVIYSCRDYPSGNGTIFQKVRARGGDHGDTVNLTWTPEIRHSECHQNVHIIDSETVDLVYDSTVV